MERSQASKSSWVSIRISKTTAKHWKINTLIYTVPRAAYPRDGTCPKMQCASLMSRTRILLPSNCVQTPELRLFTQPRCTTVLLLQLDKVTLSRKDSFMGVRTYSGNTLITLPPSRLWQTPHIRSSVTVTNRFRPLFPPPRPSPSISAASVFMLCTFLSAATILP